MYVLGIEPRALFVIRNQFETKELTDGAIPKEVFAYIVNTALKGKQKEIGQLSEEIIHFCCRNEKGESTDQAYLERYTLMHDFFQYCPHKVKKDKN